MVSIHVVGGLIGTLFVGIVGTGIGVLATGSWNQLLVQAGAAMCVLVYSFGMAWLIGTGIQRTIGFRVCNEDELAGVDAVVHGEDGYVLESA